MDIGEIINDVAVSVLPSILPVRRKYNVIIDHVHPDHFHPISFSHLFSHGEEIEEIIHTHAPTPTLHASTPVKPTPVPVPVPVKPALPTSVDLRNKFPVPYDQESLGSCTANAIGGVIEYDCPNFYPSRLYIYFNERCIENTINIDAGAALSDGIKSVMKYGVCPETEWPYDISKFTVKPPQQCYTDALLHRAVKVQNIHNTAIEMKSALASGCPFVVGIMIYESFESEQVAKTGVVSMPNKHREECLGGHAIVCCGYNDAKQQWIMRNSWGNSWADNGYFYLPYAYLLDSSLTSDLWTINSMTH